MFVVIWKYIVKPENKDTFQMEYGKSGVWEKLFKKSDGYAGSLLYSGEDDENVFILIDRWHSKIKYDQFIFHHKETYEKLSGLLSHLFISELRIGAFNLLE